MNVKGTTNSWVVLTGLLVVAILAATWFLLVSPQLAEASETRAATEQQEAANDIARIEVQRLRAQYENIEEYQAQLTDMREIITTTQRYADLQRLVADVAETHDVTVESLTFANATELVVRRAAPPVDPEATADDADAEAATDGAATAEATSTDEQAAAGVTGLYSIAITLTITGNYNDVFAALNELQTGENRLILVTSVRAGSSNDADASAGDAELQITGQTFVLVDPNEEDPLEDEEIVIDLPRSDDNPLTPSDR